MNSRPSRSVAWRTLVSRAIARGKTRREGHRAVQFNGQTIHIQRWRYAPAFAFTTLESIQVDGSLWLIMDDVPNLHFHSVREALRKVIRAQIETGAETQKLEERGRTECGGDKRKRPA